MKKILLSTSVLLLISCGETVEPSQDGAKNDTEKESIVTDVKKHEFVKFDPSACMATFTEDYSLRRDWGRKSEMITILKGEQFVVSEFESSFSSDVAATLLYPFEKGVYEFEVTLDSTMSGTPFETNCINANVQKNVGVFVDMSVYENEDLSGDSCDFKAGFSVKLTGGHSYSLSTMEQEYSVYSFGYDFLNEECPNFEIHFTTAWDVDISPGVGVQAYPFAKYLSANN
ncbi:hypothetical protein OAU52_01165 [bacterium]|nr:hypothetical protein [bacterium]